MTRSGKSSLPIPLRARSWPVCAALLLASIAGCDDSDPALPPLPPSNAPPPPAGPPAMQTGVFKDSNVSGLSYQAGQAFAVTDADGLFTCETGADVVFTLGAVSLGTAECASLVMPPTLVAGGRFDDRRTLNLTRFLLMLDRDGDPGNGIEISAGVQQIAAGWNAVDFNVADLDAALVSVISDAASVDGTAHDLPSEAEAFVHLDDSAACAYAGAFAGPFEGDRNGAVVMVVGQRRPALEFDRDAFAWLAYDSQQNWEFGGGEHFGVERSANPVVRYVNGMDSMTATFVDPDRIAGSWDLPSGDHSASFELERLGASSTGQYRFIGWLGAFRQDGALALTLDGDVVTGEAFEALRGRRAPIRGTVDGDVMDLTIDGQLFTTAVGRLSFDQDGAPVSVSGTWGRMGDFHAVACRLN